MIIEAMLGLFWICLLIVFIFFIIFLMSNIFTIVNLKKYFIMFTIGLLVFLILFFIIYLIGGYETLEYLRKINSSMFA